MSKGPFAPSGRCLTCEVSIEPPSRRPVGTLRQIGEVVDAVGLSLRTVRFYEEAGLVIPVARTAGGFRLYDDESIARLHLIMQMKPLGFTLDEMRLLIEARDRLDAPTVAGDERAGLLGRLEMFAAAAKEKCAELEAQLSVARAFSADLADDVERHHRQPARGERRQAARTRRPAAGPPSS
jgi:DNA-binding transcriptional MerR regulator